MKTKNMKLFFSLLIGVMALLMSTVPVFAGEGSEEFYDKTSSTYCREQLSTEKQKKLYDEISKILKDCYLGKKDPGTTYIHNGKIYYLIGQISVSDYTDLTVDQFGDVFYSALTDHPMAFFTSQILSGGTHFNIYTEDIFKDKAVIESYRDSLEEAVKEIAESEDPEANDIDKALAIHDAICEKAEYSYMEDGKTPSDDIFAHSIAGLIHDGRMVCEGYARLFQAASAYAGVSSNTATGWGFREESDKGEAHAWNVICIDGKYYAIDVTWDDGTEPGEYCYDYFALGQTFNDTHTTTPPKGFTDYSFITKIPALSEYNYYPDKIIDKDGCSYQQNSAGLLILTGYSGNDEKVTVPSEINGQKVITISENAFTGSTGIKELIISEGIRTLDALAFQENDSIESLSIPKSCTHIGPYALTAMYKLKDLMVDENNPSFYVKDGVLYEKDSHTAIAYTINANRGSLVIEEGTTGIGDTVFAYAGKLKRISFPASLTTMGTNVFIADSFSEETPLMLYFAGDLPDLSDIEPTFISPHAVITTHPGKTVSEERKAEYEKQCKKPNESITWKTGHIYGDWHSEGGFSHRVRKCMLCSETEEEIPTTSVTFDEKEVLVDSGQVNTVTPVSVKIEPENTTDILVWDYVGDSCMEFYEPMNGIYLNEAKEGRGVLYAYSGTKSASCNVISTKDPFDPGNTDDPGNHDNPYNPNDPGNPGNPGSTVPVYVRTVSDNLPMSFSEEQVGDYRISYFHDIPFFGSAKLSINDFEKITVKINDTTYEVTKIKVNKKKHLIQILGLSGADSNTVKALKKATKGSGGLHFNVFPYYVRNSDALLPKMKNSTLKSLKILIKGKKYKVKPAEYEYSPDTGIIKFDSSNLAGSYKF